MDLRLLACSIAVLAAAQPLAGCFFLWDRSPPGEPPVDPPALVPPREEAATFRFVASRGCGPYTGDACAPTRPLMAGVNEVVEVRLSGDDPGAEPTVRSSDPTVVEVGGMVRTSTSGGYVGLFEVHAGPRAGRADLTVTQIDGVTSTVTVRVDEAAGMDLVEDEGTQAFDRTRDHLSLRVGERVSMNGYPVNRDGERLFANDGVVWTVPGTSRVQLAWSRRTGALIADDHVYVEGRSPGTEVVTVRAGVVERTIVVDVR